MFKPGDKYVQFTPRGEVYFGQVKSVHEAVVSDIVNKIQYVSVSIVNGENKLLELDGSDGRIYRLVKDLSEDEIKFLTASKHQTNSVPSI